VNVYRWLWRCIVAVDIRNAILGCAACCCLLMVSCSDSAPRALNLSSIYSGYLGIKWGERFSDLAARLRLDRTDFGGTDREPGYEVLQGIPQQIGMVPVNIYLQFANNKLNAIHIRAQGNDKESLKQVFEILYGPPTAIPSKNTAVWQDAVATIVFQREVRGGGCLFSIINNSNYSELTGKQVPLNYIEARDP